MGKECDPGDRRGCAHGTASGMHAHIHAYHCGQKFHSAIPPGAAKKAREPLSETVLWSTFTKKASDAVQAIRPSANTTMESLMWVMGDALMGLGRDPRDDDLRTCHFIGKAKHNNPHADSIVSICSPDAHGGGDCSLTLCFDAEELSAQLNAFRQSGQATMANPALADTRLNRDLLSPTLDLATVEALEWQVALSRERTAMRRIELTASERGMLQGVVLPALAHHLLQFHATGMVVRLYRQYTPAFVRKALQGAGNGLLFLLRHPWLNTLALLLTKSLRMVLCLAAFGIEDTEWTNIKAQLLGVAQPEQRYPILNAVLDIAGQLVGCIRDGMAGGAIYSCTNRLAQLSLVGVPKWVGHLMLRTVLMILRSLGDVGTTIANATETGLQFVGDTYDLYSNASVAGAWRLVTRVFELASSNRYSVNTDAAMAETNEHMVTGMMQPVQTIFREFYGSSNLHLCTGVFLWILRRIPADTFMHAMSDFWAMIPDQCHPNMCVTLTAVAVWCP